jgi:hypothetical protein
MRVSPAYTGRILSGRESITIETMVMLSHALQFRLELEFTPCEDDADKAVRAPNAG